MDNNIVLSYEHPRLNEFIEKLHSNLNGCDGSLNKSRVVLHEMGLDVNNSIIFLNKYGGYCDCEVLYNVAGG